MGLLSKGMKRCAYPAAPTQDDLHLAAACMDNVNRAGYNKPTPVQKHALPIGQAHKKTSSKVSSFAFFFASRLVAHHNALHGLYI